MAETSSQQIRIVVVDDDRFACGGLKLMLTTTSTKVVATCLTIEEGYTAILRHTPEVAVVDLHWNNDDVAGLKLLKRLHETDVRVACLLLTQTDDLRGFIIREAFDLGARGFFRKGFMQGNKLIEVVETLARGQRSIEPELITNLLTDVGVENVTQKEIIETLPRLTPREREILALMNHGLSVKQVATWLDISPNTAKSYLRDARDKFDGRMNSYQLALFAGLHGWLRDEPPK